MQPSDNKKKKYRREDDMPVERTGDLPGEKTNTQGRTSRTGVLPAERVNTQDRITGRTGMLPAERANTQGASRTGVLPDGKAAKNTDKENASETAKKRGKTVSKQDTELARRKNEEQVRRSRRRMRQLLGFALSILILVGAVTVVTGIVDTVKGFLYNETEISEYEALITPMVWTDIVVFDTPQQLSPETVKAVAFWGIMAENNYDMPRDTETNQAMISIVELELYVGRLFGPNYSFESHETFVDSVESIEYTYDSNQDVYLMPNTSFTTWFKPKIVEVKNEADGIRRISVGYLNMVSDNGEMLPDTVVNASEPVKYMDFFFQRSGSNYYLTSLRTSTHFAVETSSASSSESPQVEEPIIDNPPSTVEPPATQDPPISSSGTEETAAVVHNIFIPNKNKRNAYVRNGF